MIEVLLSSSVLIVILVILRALFRKRIRAGIQYALWGLVALRLLLPFSFPFPAGGTEPFFFAGYGVLELADQVREQAIEGTKLQPLADNVTRGWVYHDPEADSVLIKAAGIDWQLIFFVVWAAGAIVLAVWMAMVNYRFAKMLRTERKKLCEGKYGIYRCPVYVVEGLRSPCLFEIRGETAIYVTPRVAGDEKLLRHVRAHEETHARHHDLEWSVLRTGLLCLYWINPLVWLAAVLSKRDCELACDEGAVRMLGEEERFSYGRTVLALIHTKTGPGDLLDLATTMTGKDSGIRERIRMLTSRKKRALVSTAVLLAAAAAAVLFTFTGKQEEIQENRRELSSQEPADSGLYGESAKREELALASGRKEAGDVEAENTESLSSGAIQPGPGSAMLEAVPAAWLPGQSLGADGAILDYASETRVIFHGYFGLFVFDMDSGLPIRSLNLEAIDCQNTQGDNACRISVSEDGKSVLLQPGNRERGYLYQVETGQLFRDRLSSLETGSIYSGCGAMEAEERERLMRQAEDAGMYHMEIGGGKAELEDGSMVYLSWTEDSLGTLCICAGERKIPVFEELLREAPRAEVFIDGETPVPNNNYYLEYKGWKYAYNDPFAVFMSVQAYRKAKEGDVVSIRLEEDAPGIIGARVYDYWIDASGQIKEWNRFSYEPLEETAVEDHEVRFALEMNMAAALSSTIPKDGRLYRGIAAECDFEDGNKAVYHFVLYTDW